MDVDLNCILPNPRQPRHDFAVEELQELASSIRQHGVIQAVTLEEAGDGIHYFLVDGERRVRAAKMAGLKVVPAVIRPAMNGSAQLDRLVLALVANLQRADLNPMEEALGVRALAEQGLSNNAIAHKLGKYPTWVANRLALLELDEEIQDLVAARLLPADVRSARALLSIRRAELRIETARRLARPGQTVPVVLRVAAKVAAADDGQRLLIPATGGATPMVDTAAQQALGDAARARAVQFQGKWNLLLAAGSVPPWDQVVAAARTTCEACPIYPVASAKNCADCPGVDLIRRLCARVDQYGH